MFENFFLSTIKWRTLYWKFVFKNWKTWIKLINDRNSKFISNFWKTMFSQCEVFLNLITIYYFSINNQFECFNQIVETTFKCFLIEKYKENWKNLFSQIKYFLNVFENKFIEISFFETLYEPKSKNSLLRIVRKNQNLFLQKIEAIKFLKICRQIWINAIDLIKMTQVKMTILWNN